MSPLPVYAVEQVEFDTTEGSHSRLYVRCPRCGEDFYVNLSWRLIRGVEGAGGQVSFPIGRVCPYCFKTAEIPAEVREAEGMRGKKRRTVRRRRRA